MAKEVFYRQCRLRKKLEGTSYSEQMSYIPEPFCVKGKVLKLKQDDGSWDDGWKVIVCGERQPAEWVERHERDYLKQRKASDI